MVYSDQEMHEWAGNYGIVIESMWNGDNRVCSVWWNGHNQPSIHYKLELQLFTKKGRQYGELTLERGKGPKRNSN